MKRKIVHVFLIVPFLISGCFSAMEKQGEAWGGGGSASSRSGAAAMDVVTLPLQAPFFATMAASDNAANNRAKKYRIEYRRLMSLLETNSEIALKERWDRNKDGTYWRVFADSFSNPNVKYTEETLEKIYNSVPSVRNYVFCSTACPKALLAGHFEEAWQQCHGIGDEELVNIVSNPNTPLELVEKVASSHAPLGRATDAAKRALEKRHSDQVNRLPSNQTSEPSANSK